MLKVLCMKANITTIPLFDLLRSQASPEQDTEQEFQEGGEIGSGHLPLR